MKINMKKGILTLIIIAFGTLSCFAQKVFENKQYKFAIDEPMNWIQTTNAELLKNLEKMELNDENLTKMITDNKGSILLASFTKYDPKKKAGLIPTIQINVRNKGNSNFEQFKNGMQASAESFKNMFTDFVFEKNLTEIEIDGVKSVCFIGKFTMNTKNGTEMKVRSRTYAIPYKNYFFQINFTDGQVDENCEKEFNELEKSIKIGEKK